MTLRFLPASKVLNRQALQTAPIAFWFFVRRQLLYALAMHHLLLGGRYKRIVLEVLFFLKVHPMHRLLKRVLQIGFCQ